MLEQALARAVFDCSPCIPDHQADNHEGHNTGMRSLSRCLRLTSDPAVASFAVVVWQHRLGLLTVMVCRSFMEHGNPPWRLVFLGFDDLALVMFQPMSAPLAHDLHLCLQCAVELRLPMGVRRSHLASARWADPELGQLIQRGRAEARVLLQQPHHGAVNGPVVWLHWQDHGLAG